MPAPRRQAKACRTRLRQWLAPSAAFVGMLVIVCITCHRTWGVGPDPLGDEMLMTRDRIAASEETIEGLQKRLTASRWRLDTCKGIGQQPDWSVLLKLLSDGLGDEVVLRNCELNEMLIPNGAAPARIVAPLVSTPGVSEDNKQLAFGLSVSGYGRSQTAVSQFVLRLERSGMFDSVRLVSTTREAFLNSKAVAFQVKCTLEGAN
ncbi:MAG: PilN domain-containing protein [Phycisphaerae bacterium]|jgi:hypothetical protein|nr:PilN domain-containing protein [Phycisphaerae bacterium]